MRRFQRPADAPEDQTQQFEPPQVNVAPVYAPEQAEQSGYDPADYEPMAWEPREQPRPVGERMSEFRLKVSRALHSLERGRTAPAHHRDAEPLLEPPVYEPRPTAYEPEPEEPFAGDDVVSEVPPRTEDARFPHAPLGYNRAAVDERIAELEAELEELRDTQPEVSITEEIERLGDQTASILVVAHDQANETTRLAQERADRCIADAEANARAMTEAAKQRLAELDTETDAVWRERARLLDDARSVGLALIAMAEEATERFPEEAKTVDVPGPAPAPFSD